MCPEMCQAMQEIIEDVRNECIAESYKIRAEIIESQAKTIETQREIIESQAILQLNSKKTPANRYFDITKIRTDKLKPQMENLWTIGFPRGFTLGLDKKTHDLQPGIRSCKCSKEPSRYEFEVEGAAVGGQSGSPIFDKYGHLLGLVSKSYSDASTIWAYHEG